jgi:hypothetical protein
MAQPKARAKPLALARAAMYFAPIETGKGSGMDVLQMPWVEPAMWLFVGVVSAFAGAALFGYKGRSRAVGFLLGILLGPIGLLITLLVGPATPETVAAD